VIRDSRHLYGAFQHASTEEVEGAWRVYAADRGRDLTDRTTDTPLDAYVSDSRWVADCPCRGGIACWPAHEKGCCYDCLSVYRIAFPADAAAAVAVLELRPDPATRNWFPDREDVASLKVENAVRGERFVA
jgi:hypothetical protein